jgi:hypothetical protein
MQRHVMKKRPNALLPQIDDQAVASLLVREQNVIEMITAIALNGYLGKA